MKKKIATAPKVIYPKANQKSNYNPMWEPYIASNLHLYTIPLAIFLRRARELDFSPKHYRRSLDTVVRVFRVFSPEVVGVINKLLNGTSPFSNLVVIHTQHLGVHAPVIIQSTTSLVSCQEDMHDLLEEIYLQHLKKLDALDIFDRAIAKMESYFGGGAYTGEEKELKKMVEKAKVVVGFPATYQVMPDAHLKNNDSSVFSDSNANADRMDRTSGGMLTNAGRQRLMDGYVKCNPEDVDYLGDKMFGRSQTHEIRFLIPLLIQISQMLNGKLGLAASSSSVVPRRFNLRFLADYRNLVFICFVSWFWNVVRG
jgi:hypothetical protein